MTITNPLQDALRELAVLLAEQSHFIHDETETPEEWMQSPALQRIVQKLWDEGRSWGYEQAKAEGRERSEARGQDLTALAIKFESLGNEANAAWVETGDAELEVIANVYYKCARSVRSAI